MHLEWRPSAHLTGPEILTSVTAAEADELSRLASGRRVLEIGSAYGYSACVMALGGAEHVTAVDPHGAGTWLGDTLSVMRANLDACGVAGKVTIVREYSGAALPALAEARERFGLVFIDGDHRLQGASDDIANALKLTAPGDVIAVHDVLEHCCCPDVLEAVSRAFPGGPSEVVDTMFVIRR